MKQFFCFGVIQTLCSLKDKNKNLLQFTREHNITFSSAIHQLKILSDYKLLEIKKSKKELCFDLTDKGKTVQLYLLKIIQEL